MCVPLCPLTRVTVPSVLPQRAAGCPVLCLRHETVCAPACARPCGWFQFLVVQVDRAALLGSDCSDLPRVEFPGCSDAVAAALVRAAREHSVPAGSDAPTVHVVCYDNEVRVCLLPLCVSVWALSTLPSLQADIASAFADLAAFPSGWPASLTHCVPAAALPATMTRPQACLPAALWRGHSNRTRRVVLAHLAHGHDVRFY